MYKSYIGFSIILLIILLILGGLYFYSKDNSLDASEINPGIPILIYHNISPNIEKGSYGIMP